MTQTLHKTYGDAAFTLTGFDPRHARVTSSNTSVATISGRTVTVHGAGTTNLIKSTKGYKKASLVVAKASQTYTLAASQTVLYTTNGQVSLPAATEQGLALAYASSDPAVATASGATVTVVAPGTTTLTATQAGNANYLPATSKTQQLTVERNNQEITLPELGLRPVGSPAFVLNGAASSGLPVSYTSSVTAVAQVTGSVVTVGSPGTTTITARQTGNIGYFPAPDRARTLTVFQWNPDGTMPAELTDVQTSFNEGSTQGTGYVSAVDHSVDGDNLPKHLLIDVPDYYGTGGAERQAPRSYLQLGASPEWGTPATHGDDLLTALGLVAGAGGLVPPRYYLDDWRDLNKQQHASTTYHWDDGTASPSRQTWPSNAGNAGVQLTQKLLSRGGWRDHTDGNRVVTTRGDRVDVIGGNYRLVVLGRLWSPQNADNHGWGLSYWESTGGHNKDSTNTPGEVVHIAHNEGTWQVVQETLKGNQINHYRGVSEEYYKGPSLISRVGSKSSGVIPTSSAAAPQQQTDQLTAWINPDGRTQKNPSITGTTSALASYSDTAVAGAIVQKSDVSGEHKTVTKVGADVTLASYVPQPILGSPKGVTDKHITFKSRLHAIYIGADERFSTKTESFAGDWTFKVDMLTGLKIDLGFNLTKDLITEGQFKLSASFAYNMGFTLGASAEAKVGLWIKLGLGTKQEFSTGKLTIRTPLRASAWAKTEGADVAKMKTMLSTLRAYGSLKST